MARFSTTIPWQFNNAPGDQPGSRLDDNFDAVNDGTLTIRAEELSDGVDYDVQQDDEYSFFVCKGTDDFQIIPPLAPPAGFGFFFSNETTQEAVEIGVTLCCTVFVGTTEYTNPELVQDFPPHFYRVKGGLVQYNGSDYYFYPLFFAQGGKFITSGVVNVAEGATSVTITHGFSEAGIITVLVPEWNTQVWQTGQTTTTATFAFSNPVPAAGASPAVLQLTYFVILP
jgi:hypothetical protein